jgi:hypothetical protein
LVVISTLAIVAVASAVGLESGKAVRISMDRGLPPSQGPAVPSPGDTILYDDGTPTYYYQFIGTDMYWAVRFTPAENCTVTEAHFGIYYVAGTSPTCTLFVWDDNAGEPGTAVHTQTFTPDMMNWWNYLTIGTPITYSAGTDFWLGFFIQEPAGADTTCILTDGTLDHGDRSYIGDGGAWYPGSGFPFPGDLLIRAYVEYVTAANHDVAPDSVTSPPDTVMPDSTYMAIAWVHNYGDTTEAFNVECTIDPGGYLDTAAVLPLAPGGDYMVSFTNWVVPPDDSTAYTMCVVTLLGTDTSPRNDTLCTDIYALAPSVHDVGVDSIVVPPDTVEAGMSYNPTAWVSNYGNQSEVFQVLCEIDTGGYVVWADTEAVFNLDPGNSQQVAFGIWDVPPDVGVNYQTCMWTDLTDDAVPANDTLCKLSVSVTGVAGGLRPRTPEALTLHQSVPNPFSSMTRISYETPIAGRVSIAIYDATGGLVRVLTDEDADAGYYTAIWNGRTDSGSMAPEGVYFYKLSLAGLESTGKLVLVR